MLMQRLERREHTINIVVPKIASAVSLLYLNTQLSCEASLTALMPLLALRATVRATRQQP